VSAVPTTSASDGLPLFYECFPAVGTSHATVLLLMGLGSNARIWAPVVEPLRADGYDVVVMDNRGCGRSGVPWKPWSTRTMAGDARAVLDAAEVPRAHVIGASMGGMIAQELALAAPDRVDSLVLGCTSGGLPRGPALATRHGVRHVLGMVGRAFRRAAPADPVLEFLRVNVSPDFAAAAAPGGPAWQAVEAMLADPMPTRGLLHQALATARHSTWSRLGRLTMPVQVQHGTADKVIPVHSGRALARRIPRAVFEPIEGAGHALGIEHPAEITRRALAFLARHPGGGMGAPTARAVRG
jgi:3-oxoadipate enol-lactonase